MSDFWSHGLQLLRYRPWPVLKAAYWQLTRRRVRAGHILRRASAGTPLAYSQWLRNREAEWPAIAERVAAVGRCPSFTIIVHGDAQTDRRLWQRSEQSITENRYQPVVLQRYLGADLAADLATVETDYVFFLQAGDRLAACALFRLAERIGSASPPLLYGDEDRRLANGQRTPWFKPDWNGELYLAVDYLSGAVALRRDVAQAAASAQSHASIQALLLRATASGGDIEHLHDILVHRGRQPAPGPGRRVDVQAHLGQAAVSLDGPFGTVRVQWPLPEPAPLVSIIIPTRDRVELLRTCVESVLGRTDYQPFEIVVVDNGSEEAETLSFFAELTKRANVRAVRSEAPFNFSSLNNLGVQASTGDYLCLLNNDTEVIAPEWLSEMMRQAVRPHVGAVGAKLLYDDHTIQHAGVVVGMGEAAGHAHRFQADVDAGYFAQAHAAQYMTAVTAACLVVARAKFDAIGGFDEQAFAVAYNDVDLCLRLQQAGWRNLYTPHAVLYHHESKSRGDDLSPVHRDRYMRELATLQRRWGTKKYRDPLHSPNLDRYSETFTPVIELEP